MHGATEKTHLGEKKILSNWKLKWGAERVMDPNDRLGTHVGALFLRVVNGENLFSVPHR